MARPIRPSIREISGVAQKDSMVEMATRTITPTPVATPATP